jgi:hypothetical protein
VTVYSALRAAVTAAVDRVLGSAGVRHIAHEERDAAEGACAANKLDAAGGAVYRTDDLMCRV